MSSTRLPPVSLADRLIFAVVNLALYLRHPLFTQRYIRRLHRWPNYAAPGRLSELVQWRKLFDRNPLFTQLSDKLAVRDWVRERAPSLAAPEIVFVADRPEDIPDDRLVPGFVIKTTHNTSQNYFPSRGDWGRARFEQIFRQWLQRVRAGEWAYKDVPHRILVERELAPQGTMIDFSFRGFDGHLSLAHVASSYKTPAVRFSYFSLDGRRVAEARNTEPMSADFVVPDAFAEAAAFARQLTRDLDYARADFLWDGQQVYFSEMTLYPASGYGGDDAMADLVFRPWMSTIDKSWFLRTSHSWPLSLYAAAFRRWAARQRNIIELNGYPLAA